jgi:hypothetical protein
MGIDQVVANSKDSQSLVSTRVPTCQECTQSGRVRPSVHSYRGPYFCIQCCNYIDERGKTL